jgi:hypothetical protein
MISTMLAYTIFVVIALGIVLFVGGPHDGPHDGGPI